MSKELTFEQALDRLVKLSTQAVEAAQGRGWETVEKDFDELDAQLDRLLGAPNPAREGR